MGAQIDPKIDPKIDAKIDAEKEHLFDPLLKTCLSKGTGSAVYVEVFRVFSFSWILITF